MATNNYFKSIEKITNRVWQSGKLTFETIVTTGNKNSNDNRLDALYLNTYDSEKYNNVSKLDSLSINPTFWCAISYKDYDDNNKFFTEEVWMSYKQLELFKNFLTDIMSQIEENIDRIYKKNKITKEYEDTMWQSETMSGGKSFAAYPCIAEDSNGNSVNGVGFLIVDEDNESIGVEVSLTHFITLVGIVSEYNLYNSGHAVFIESLLVQLLSNSSDGVSRPASGIGNRTIGTKSGGRKSGFKRPSFNHSSSVNDEDDNEDEDEEVEEKPKKKVVKKSPSNSIKGKKSSTSSESNKKVSLQEMLDAADEIDDVDLNDEKIDF